MELFIFIAKGQLVFHSWSVLDMSGSLIVEKANLDDAKLILSVQKLAYQEEAKIYGAFQIPPLLETLEELKCKFKTHLILKATIDGRVVGSIRVLSKDGTCHISRLMVHPDYQNRGIATKLLLEIECIFQSCSRFELFTGEKSFKSIRLYEKMGYRVFKTDQPPGNVKLVYLAKTR